MEIKDLMDNPGTAEFSRLKYIGSRGSEELIAEFLNALFHAAAAAKYNDDWESLSEFLDKWDDIGIGLQFQGLKIPDTDGIPWARLEKPLDQCTIALVTTGGVFMDGQTPYSERGDASYREIPRDTPTSEFRIWHPGYDTGPATADINCIFPLDRFRELEAEGVIGRLAAINYSFMGLIPEPQERLMPETAPEVGRSFKEAGVDAVFLAST